MYYVFYYFEGEMNVEYFGMGKESGPWAWRYMIAHIDYRAWLEYEKIDRRIPERLA
jgi:hypothetical protein